MLRHLFCLAVFAICCAAGMVTTTSPVLAHCDTLDGPVVQAAKNALEKGDVKLVLIWVKEDGEAEVHQAFQDALKVRKLGADARKLADRYFFETLVRVHRAGEGEPYTGLKPAGTDAGPAVEAADEAVKAGKVEPVVKLVSEATVHAVRERFEQMQAASKYDPADVEAGRKYVAAYVVFLHTVDGIYEKAKAPAHGAGTKEAIQHEQ